MAETNEELDITGSDDLEGSAFDNPIVRILRGFNVSDETIRRINQAIQDGDIEKSDLAALSDDDLQRFGIENEKTRTEMLLQFSNSPNQSLHYEKYIQEMEMEQYHETVYKNALDQLKVMNKVLAASQKVLQTDPVKFDKLVDDTVYVSSLNTKTMKEILKTVSRITNTAESNRWNICMYSLAGLVLLGSLASLRKIVEL